MTDLVWDETGARYFETGVSKGTFFDMNFVGVPWNGLVAVNLDPTGGELEPYYFDGVKYMERVLAEDFQATIQAISTPREFDVCEGVKVEKPGMRTYFHKRDKFNLVWRTNIGNDVDSEVGYKIHLAYNCTVQPSGRAYATISDNTTPDIRSFVITTTPACGRHSYYTFSSLECDLTDLEAQLNAGVLPRCYGLKALIGPLDPDNPPPVTNEDCPALIEDLEAYDPGQNLMSPSVDNVRDVYETFIYGIINNGLDTTELPATGTFTVNDSVATEVGTGDILADDDDATYITSADGDLGYTIGLPSLVGYVDGANLELHIRMSITGDVSEDDPDNIDADAQVHISTDATGDTTIGGFSDGADEGMGFALSAVDGTIVDYVVPLSMDAWVDSSLDDVIAALEAGAYLNVVGASNNNFSTTPEVRVYEMSVVMLDATDSDNFLRARDSDTYCQIALNIYDTPGSGLNYKASVTDSVDFKVHEVPDSAGAAGDNKTVLHATTIEGSYAFTAAIDTLLGYPALKWFWSDPSAYIWSEELVPDVWYTLQLDWAWTHYNIKIFERESGLVLRDVGDDHTIDPWTQVYSYGGFVGDA